MYISQDPIRLSDGTSLYAYVSDPNDWVDVFGLAKRAGNTSFTSENVHPETITPDNQGETIIIQITSSHAGDKVAVYDKTKNPDVWSGDYRVHHVSSNVDNRFD